MKKLFLAGLITTITGAATTEAAANVYVETGIGVSEMDLEHVDYHQITLDGIIGFNFHSNMSAEIGVGLGIKDDDTEESSAMLFSMPGFAQPISGVQDVTTKFTLDHKITAAIKLHGDLQSNFVPYAKLGAIYMENAIEVTGHTTILIQGDVSDDDDFQGIADLHTDREYNSFNVHYFAELGASYKVSDNISVSGSYFIAPDLEFDDFDIDGTTQTIEADYSGFNLGINIAF